MPVGNGGPSCERLFVCYIPGLDLRRVDGVRTPFLASLLDEFDGVRLRGLPDTELFPTLLTGAWPHEHGMWQLRLRPESGEPSGWARLWMSLPDAFTTTAQGVAHALTGSQDLSTMPPRRRRRFELRRFKYERRERGWTEPSSEHPSVLTLVGAEACRYRLVKRFEELEALEEEIPASELRLEFLELYALDILEHWNLDRPARVDEGFRRVDAFVQTIHERLFARDTGFVLLSDHGQEPVRGSIDIGEALGAAGVPTEEYEYYAQVPSVRFWFHTDRARASIGAVLRELEHVTVLNHLELGEHGVRFDGPEFGELYAYAEPGWVFFPHDFYHPLANLFLGLSDPAQRPRISNPVHRGCHGYLTGHDSETGLFLTTESAWTPARTEGELVDFAPTVLSMLGEPVPERMSGRSLLEPRG